MTRLIREVKGFVAQFWTARAEILLIDRQPSEGYTPFAFLIPSWYVQSLSKDRAWFSQRSTRANTACRGLLATLS